MTIAAATGSTETRTCSVCGTSAPHSEHVTSDSRCEPVWLTAAHDAPCGLPCFGGGVKPAQIRGDGVHGYHDWCPRCGPLRVLPEVAKKMRERAEEANVRADAATTGPFIAVSPRDQRGATVAHCGPTFTHEPSRRATSIRSLGVVPLPTGDAPGSWEQAERNAVFIAEARAMVPGLSADVLRCLDEIDKLTRERNDALQALVEAREQVTALDMKLTGRVIDAEEASGSAVATALDLLECFVLLHEPGTQTRDVGDETLAKARDELKKMRMT